MAVQGGSPTTPLRKGASIMYPAWAGYSMEAGTHSSHLPRTIEAPSSFTPKFEASEIIAGEDIFVRGSYPQNN